MMSFISVVKKGDEEHALEILLCISIMLEVLKCVWWEETVWRTLSEMIKLVWIKYTRLCEDLFWVISSRQVFEGQDFPHPSLTWVPKITSVKKFHLRLPVICFLCTFFFVLFCHLWAMTRDSSFSLLLLLLSFVFCFCPQVFWLYSRNAEANFGADVCRSILGGHLVHSHLPDQAYSPALH